MASQDSVHMLTNIRFPPPALFFADSEKKWTMNDFEKSDKPPSYSVTDENTTDIEQKEQVQDRITTEVAVEPEPEMTTIEKPVDETKDDRKQVSSTTETSIVETENIKQITTDKSINGTRDGEQVTMESGKPIGEPAADRWQETVEVSNPSTSTKFEKLTMTFGRRKHPTDLWRPFRTIKLTSRPLPTPTSEIRFSQINYTGVRQHYKKSTTNLSFPVDHVKKSTA